ncbi:MAG: hypothetical protein ACTHNZ_11545 [Trinickia sp.]|uniref:hypothetical protein n=1 Tax=Trinickia sp. TaxID=2571163 RepID=UPI003F7D4223
MQSVPGGATAHKHDRHFANPSVGWANYPLKKPVAWPPACHERISGWASAWRSPANSIWRAVPLGTARLTAFISVSTRFLRTPMNSPLRSARRQRRRAAGSGFEEGCSSN